MAQRNSAPNILPSAATRCKIGLFYDHTISQSKQINPLGNTTKRVGTLDTPIACRRELAKVYREARNGLLETSDATRFASILNTLIGMIRDSDLEERLRQLGAAETVRQ